MSDRRLLLTDAALQPVIRLSRYSVVGLIAIGTLHAFIHIAAVNQRKKLCRSNEPQKINTMKTFYANYFLNVKIFRSTVGGNVIGALNNL